MLLIDGRQFVVPGGVLFLEVEISPWDMVLDILVVILLRLDTSERHAENNGGDEIEDKQLALPALRRIHREDHGQTA